MVLKIQQKDGSQNKENRQSQVVSMNDPQMLKEEKKGQRSCSPLGSPQNLVAEEQFRSEFTLVWKGAY